MRALFVLITAISLIACNNTATKKPYQSGGSLFKSSMRMGCNMKYPNSKSMCNCHAEVIDRVTPTSVKNNMLSQKGQRELISIMLDNKDELDACGTPPSKKKTPPPVVCYPDDSRPQYYLDGSQTDELNLTAEQQELIDSISPSVSDEQLLEHYFASVEEQMNDLGELLNTRLMKDDKNTLDINNKIKDNTAKTIQCSDKSMRKFYTDSEVDALYRLFYAGEPQEDAKETIFRHALSRRQQLSANEYRQRIEMEKYLRCEIKLCMNK